MKASRTYFERNRGAWDWHVEIALLSWSGLWGSEIPFFSKVCLSFLSILQKTLGSIRMRTCVDIRDSSEVVHHSTKMKKWGMTIYGSEKLIRLEENGVGLRLDGYEYYGPFGFLRFPFKPTAGLVEESSTCASYKMPMAGTQCDCRAFLEVPLGYMEISTPWLHGRFTLTDASNDRLQARFRHQ